MSGRINMLAALLAVQLAIIAVVLFAGSGFGERKQGPFLTFEPDAVDEIRITGGETPDDTVVISRSEEGWRLPDGLPADSDKVAEVLETLEGLRAPWPVATSGGAAERFEVAEDQHQRHLVLMSGGDVAVELYLGTSPGYQQVHARRADDDGVYSVGLANYQLPAEADQWLDKTLLQPRGDVAAVARREQWRLSRTEEGWLLGDAAADRQAAEDLVRRLSELRVTGVAEAPEQAAEPAAVLEVTDDEGEYRLTIVGEEESQRYSVQSSRREEWFGLAGYLADQLLVDEASLQPAAEGGPGDAEPQPDDPGAAPAAEPGDLAAPGDPSAEAGG